MTASSQVPSGIDILLVDGDPVFCGRVADRFESHNSDRGVARGRLNLTAVMTLEEAITALKNNHYHLVIANRSLHDGSGLDLLPASGSGHFPVVLIADDRGERLAVEAIKAGAIDYLVKTAQALHELPEFINGVLQEWEMMLAHQRMQLEMGYDIEYRQCGTD